jgi:hypothetical protein
MRSLLAFWKRLVMLIICSFDCLVIKSLIHREKKKKKQTNKCDRYIEYAGTCKASRS